MFETPNNNDIEVISVQLNRNPRGLVRVAQRCKFSLPSVIATYPELECGEFFPTIFWLSCPGLYRETAKLESSGLINELQERIKNEELLADKLQAAHHKYREIREQMATQANQKVNIKSQNLGIAGVHNEKNIKCLHAHLAQYLATGHNPIGQIIESLIQEEKVFEECHKCRSGRN